MFQHVVVWEWVEYEACGGRSDGVLGKSVVHSRSWSEPEGEERIRIDRNSGVGDQDNRISIYS